MGTRAGGTKSGWRGELGCGINTSVEWCELYSAFSVSMDC
jgi:hypothetical protein